MRNKLLSLTMAGLLMCSSAFAAADFDGVDDYASGSHPTQLDGATQLTYAGWLYLDAVNSHPTAADNIVRVDGTASLQNVNSVYRFTLWHGAGASRVNSVIPTSQVSGSWQHIAIRWNKDANSGYPEMFVNGVKDSDGVSLQAATLYALATNPLVLGGANTGAEAIDGAMTMWSGWSVALTDAEILQLASSKTAHIALQIRPANLIFSIPMDEVSGGVAAHGSVFKDLSGNGYNLTADDGANNTGMTGRDQGIVSYP